MRAVRSQVYARSDRQRTGRVQPVSVLPSSPTTTSPMVSPGQQLPWLMEAELLSLVLSRWPPKKRQCYGIASEISRSDQDWQTPEVRYGRTRPYPYQEHDTW